MNIIRNKVMNYIRKIRAVIWWRHFKLERQEWVNTTISKYEGNDLFKEEVTYLKKYGADYFPYEWCKNKHVFSIRCGGYRANTDDEPYVVHNGKKLYMNLRAYTQLLLEQNPRSAHRYFTDAFHVSEGDVFVDVGGAEGMISLDIIEIASKVYILECDEFWIKRLQKTFEPYKKKVEIINKYASDHEDEQNITLDSLLQNETAPCFIKMDVEGMEDMVLAGAREVLTRKDTKVAICTYHKKGDDEKFHRYFGERGYKTEFSDGYMAMCNEDSDDRFRKAMLRCWK